MTTPGHTNGCNCGECMTRLRGPERQARCHVLDRHRNPCPNPSLPDTRWCLKHLAEAASDFKRLAASAAEQFPQLRGMFDSLIEEDTP